MGGGRWEVWLYLFIYVFKFFGSNFGAPWSLHTSLNDLISSRSKDRDLSVCSLLLLKRCA